MSAVKQQQSLQNAAGDLTEVEQGKVCDTYSSFFSTAKYTDPVVNLRVTGPLKRVFSLLQSVVLDKYDRQKYFFTMVAGNFLYMSS